MADQYVNARLAFIKVASDTFGAEEGSSIEITADLIETTNKSNTSAKQFIHDIYGATASATGIIPLDDTTGAIATLESLFLTNILAGTAATLIFVLQEASPTTTLTASALVTTWSADATQTNVIKGTFAFQLTGDITIVETST